MTNQPYTDADLRTEAARQLATSMEDPDFMGIGEQMDGSFIDSTVVDPDDSGQGREPITGTTWDQLAPHEFGEAQREIDHLLGKAADVSEWAINLGADGLQPDEHQITVQGNSRPIARIHFAFEPDMPDNMRTALVEGIGQAIGDAL